MTIDVRNKRVVKKIDLKNGAGLELGPLTSPVVTKDEGKIFYLDHMSQDDLKKKYKKEPVDPDKIVPIDYVLQGSLKETVGKKKFDYVIASHVIEHIPDTISWLKDVSDILKPGGILSLVIPDKRYTFDIEREVSQPADIIGAYIDKLKKPTSAMMYDFASLYAEDIDTASVWRDSDYYTKLPPKHRWSHHEAVDMCIDSKKPGKYVDSHCHVFTPASFATILRELTTNGLIDFEVAWFMETQEYELEFFVSLRKTGKDVTKGSLLRKIPKIQDEDSTNKIEELNMRNEHLEKEILAIQNSLSWRVTRILREAKKIPQSIRRK